MPPDYKWPILEFEAWGVEVWHMEPSQEYKDMIIQSFHKHGLSSMRKMHCNLERAVLEEAGLIDAP